MNFDNDPRLRHMNPLKVRIIKEIASGSRNASMEEMLPEIMQINKEMKRRGLEFTKSESDLIMDIMMENLPPADRKKVAMLRSMM